MYMYNYIYIHVHVLIAISLLFPPSYPDFEYKNLHVPILYCHKEPQCTASTLRKWQGSIIVVVTKKAPLLLKCVQCEQWVWLHCLA